MILMWFTGAYIKNTKYFVKLIFKIFTLEISKKKVPNILPRPVKHNLCLLFRSAHLAKTFFSVRDKLPATSALSKKKITAKKMKRFNLIQPPSGKSYDRHFEIIIECCRTIRLSDYQAVGLQLRSLLFQYNQYIAAQKICHIADVALFIYKITQNMFLFLQT